MITKSEKDCSESIGIILCSESETAIKPRYPIMRHARRFGICCATAIAEKN
jgi:hypothetical protein